MNLNLNMVKLVDLPLIVLVVPLPDETVELCKKSDADSSGAVGGPKWDTHPVHLRPEQGLLKIRKELNLYANLRPTTIIKVLQILLLLKKNY